MNYDFIRKLAVKVSEQEAGAIIKLLLSHNIETYAEGTSEERKRGRMYVAIQSEPVNATVLSGGNLYVAAADHARAIEILGENGYDAVICHDEQEAAVLTETERAMQEYYRKRKQNNLVALAIVIVVFIFLFLRGIVG